MFIFWFALFALMLLYGQVLLFRRFIFHQLEYSRAFKQTVCFRGDEIELVERLDNKKRLPIPWLRVESQLSSQLAFRKGENFDVSSGEVYQNHRSLFSLGGYTRLTRTHTIRPMRRGVYELNSVTMTGGDLFGHTHVCMQIPLNDRLVVYPKPADVPFDELPSCSWQGDHSVRRFIVPDPFVVAGARAYSAGDSMKQINWKATARRGELQVHKYDFTADRKLLICLNGEDGEQMWKSISNEKLIEHGIEWAAGVAERAVAQSMEVGFCTNMPMDPSRQSVSVEPGRGQEHLVLIYETLARLILERTESFKELLETESLKAYSNCDVLVISAYWNDELELSANRLRAKGNSVSVWQLNELTDDEPIGNRETTTGQVEGRGA
ncbi:DUF58 domain-containing protein [Paenibacillus sp. GCM10027627]|uniref:DUF58 domain-containing protein n=1 Tax=unclassified Paenibacillus TaxID=185978 RepID=UPI003642D997